MAINTSLFNFLNSSIHELNIRLNSDSKTLISLNNNLTDFTNYQTQVSQDIYTQVSQKVDITGGIINGGILTNPIIHNPVFTHNGSSVITISDLLGNVDISNIKFINNFISNVNNNFATISSPLFTGDVNFTNTSSLTFPDRSIDGAAVNVGDLMLWSENIQDISNTIMEVVSYNRTYYSGSLDITNTNSSEYICWNSDIISPNNLITISGSSITLPSNSLVMLNFSVSPNTSNTIEPYVVLNDAIGGTKTLINGNSLTNNIFYTGIIDTNNNPSPLQLSSCISISGIVSLFDYGSITLTVL